MRDVHADVLVVRDVLYEIIRIRLLPVSARARCAADTAQRSAICIVVVRLHVPWCTPRVCVHGLHAVRLDGFGADPDLAVVVAIPDVLWRCAGAAWGLWLDGDHVVRGGVRRGSDAVA